MMNVIMVPGLLDAYKWLVCYLLELTTRKLLALQEQGKDLFTARNDSQVFYAKTLSCAFIEVDCMAWIFRLDWPVQEVVKFILTADMIVVSIVVTKRKWT